MKMRSTTTTTSTSRSRKNKFLRIVTTPYRALCKAGDLYVRSITRCGQPVSYTPSRSKSISNLPRSFSTASSTISALDNEDYRELVTAASIRTLTDNSIEIDTMMLRSGSQLLGLPRSVPRSASVGMGMGRIDEEAPFEGEVLGQTGVGMVGGIGKNKARGDLLYPRSKSYVTTNRNVAF